VTEILIYVITVSEVSSSAISPSNIPYSWFSLDKAAWLCHDKRFAYSFLSLWTKI